MLTNLGQFLCHRVVGAGQIIEIARTKGNDGCLVAYRDADNREAWVNLPSDWDWRHKARAGGYIVQHADGYISFSPTQAFEEGYTRIEA